MKVNKYIDHTALKSSTTEREIIDLCNEAKEHQIYDVCVSSSYVPLAKQVVSKSAVNVCSVVGFPLVNMSTEAKVFQAQQAVTDGAE